MNHPARAILPVVGLLLAGCTVSSEPPNLAGQDVRLTIVHTADVHSRLFPYQFAPGAIDKGLGLVPTRGNIAVVGGAARMATVVRCIRGDELACGLKLNDAPDHTVSELVGGSSPRTIHLDSGDIFEGAPVFNVFAGEVEMRAMTRLGLNAMALGNHEFDKGAVNLELMKNKFGGFPILAANYQFVDPKEPTNPKLRLVIAPFQIFNVQGLRVGVVGMGNLSSLQSLVEGGNSLGIVPLEATSAIKNAVNFLRGQVDLVVMISHLGLDEDEGVAQTKNADDSNPVIDGVDVILGGHLHIVLNPPQDLPRFDEQGNPTGHTVVCHSGAFAKYVGRLDLAVHIADPKVQGDRNGVKSYTYKIIPIDDSIPDDADMANMLEPYQLRMNTFLNLTHEYAIVPCPRTASTCPKVIRSDPNGGDSQLGNLVATAMRLRRRVEADFSITNSLGIRADFESGPLNLEQLYNVFPFENTITSMFLSGNEIQQTLDFIAARSAERGCKTQSQISGLWVTLDCSARRTVKDSNGNVVMENGKPKTEPFAIACGPFDPSGARALRCHPDDRSLDGPYLIGDRCLEEPARCTPVLPSGEYRVAVNDYIANGGSGFAVLKRNTTKFNTGISLRDALTDFLTDQGNRCDPLVHSNVALVQCLTVAGDPSMGTTDCTLNCCRDPDSTSFACSTQSRAFQGCQALNLQPQIVYDRSGLPCLDGSVEPHDGRITASSGGK